MADDFRGHTPFWFRARVQLDQEARTVLPREITVRVFAFVLWDVKTGRRLGHALIAPDAHYVSIAWAGSDALDRKHPGTADWHLLKSAIKDGLPASPLESTHAIARMLVHEDDRDRTAVQYVSAGPVNLKSPQATVAVLDAWVLGLEAR